MNLPIYKAVISDDECGMYCLSLVDEPAVESNFLYFSKEKQQFKVENEEQRIVTGVIMRCDFPIYRRTAAGYEYYVMYDKQTIDYMAEKWLADGLHNNINLQHNPNSVVKDIYLKEVFFKNVDRGVNPKGYEDIEDGSLFGTYKVMNDEVWDEIKKGTFKGFSLEGLFDMVEVDDKTIEDEIIELLSRIIEKNKKK